MSSKTTVDRAQLWKELHEVLKHRHIADGDDTLDSINRLLRKNDRVKETMGSFQLRRDRAQITAEYWELQKLVSLMTSSQVTTDKPVATSGAAVVVRREPFEFLVDGRRRINHWERSAALGPYRVLVVSEEAE